MDFLRTNQEKAQFDSVRDFAVSALNNNITDADLNCRFNAEGWHRCAQFGVLGWAIPKELGGAGLSTSTITYLMEALGEGCTDNGLTFALGAQMWSVQKILSKYGSDDQKANWLHKLHSGQRHAAFAITEANSGSDAFSLKTTAEQVGNSYVLNGEKVMITMAPIADCIIVFAATDPKASQWGLSAFVVDAKAEGVERLANEPKMGLRTVPFGGIRFNNCILPADALLGKIGAGASLFNTVQGWERSLVLAPQVGAMQRILNECIRESKTRQRGGSPIGTHQAVSHRIANIRMRLETSRLLLYKTSLLLDANKQSILEAAITKTHISEAFVATCHDAIAIHGGAGYITQTEIERQLRDAVGATLYGGTVDIQRNIIAGLLNA